MASKTLVLLEDDLTGGEADETVEFALDGKPYAIDLNEKNAERLREALSEFIPHARKASGGRASAPRRSSPASASGLDAGAIRSWAQQNGHQVSARGRISKAILDAYHAAIG